MIPVTISHKDVVFSFFKEDIDLLKKEFSRVSMDFDDAFDYVALKEFVYSAAGMFKDLDADIYNKNLVLRFQTIRNLDRHFTNFKQKSEYSFNVYTNSFLCAQHNYVDIKREYDRLKDELQSALADEDKLEKEIKYLEVKLQRRIEKNEISKKDIIIEQIKIKPKRGIQVDSIHATAKKKERIGELFNLISTFEESNRSLFVEIFEDYKQRIEYQYITCLNFFGEDFSTHLFLNSEQSRAIQRFKREANIQGDITICKFYEYYSRNINPDALSDLKMQEKLKIAKSYCESKKKREEVEF